MHGVFYHVLQYQVLQKSSAGGKAQVTYYSARLASNILITAVKNNDGVPLTMAKIQPR